MSQPSIESLPEAPLQEGGSAGELYLHAFDSQASADEYRAGARDEGSSRTTPAIEVPRALVGAPGFYEACEALMRASSVELGYPERESSADRPRG